MNPKLRAATVALCLAATAFLGVAAALPPYVPPNGLAYVGPQPTPCTTPQALGAGGDASGSDSYHSYANAVAREVLDGCIVLPSAGFPTCAATAAASDATLGAAQILTLTLVGVLSGVNTATSGASDLYQRDCGGLVGTGSDGELEFGSRAAALNVREGAGIEPLVFQGGRFWGGNSGGDGIDACIDPAATPHHALDTTVFVEDVVSGGNVGFTLAADWARPAGLSSDNTDRNNRPGIAHCGDGAIEPCDVDPHAGVVNDAAFHGGAAAVVGDATHLLATPTDLMHALDVLLGCNPLDVVAYQPPAPMGSSVNAMDPPSALLSDFGNGGASGWLLVIVDPVLSTVGWVWSGA